MSVTIIKIIYANYCNHIGSNVNENMLRMINIVLLKRYPTDVYDRCATPARTSKKIYLGFVSNIYI